MSYPGKLLVFEGIDGTGKSTQIRRLVDWLRGRGQDVIASREPTDGPWGRKILQSAITGRMPLAEELECFLEDRREHVNQTILPALHAGNWVVLDRYYLSNMAYQGARGMDPAEIRRRNEEFAPVPDLVFWLDLPVDLAMGRIGRRGEGDTAFEKRESLEACRRIFAQLEGETFLRRIDAAQEADAVFRDVCMALHSKFPDPAGLR